METWEKGFRLVEKSQDMQELFKFGNSIGVYLNSKVSYPASFFPGYLGAVALEALDPYETILTAPTPSFLSISLSNDPKLKQIFLDNPEDFAEGDGGENNRFIAFILFELSKGSASFWYPYLKTLPTDIEVLSDWTESDLTELQDEVLLQYSVNKNIQESECNEAIQQIFANYPQLISPEHAIKVPWAWKVILTRAYGRCLPALSLIPIADIFNHTNIETNYYYGELDEEDHSEFDDTDEDHDDALPLKIVNLNYFRLAKLSTFFKKGAKVQSFLERAKEEDRKLFLKSKK